MERLTRQLTLDGALSPAGLLRLLQEIAGDDAARRGGGQDLLLSRGCTWVLVKNRLEIARWPQPGESLRLVTLPLKGRLGLCPRCYELLDAAGESLVRAESLWAIMDVASRGMIAGEERGIALRGLEEGRIRPQRRLSIPEGGACFDLSPRPEQIDENGHMNNAAYLDAAAEMLPAAFRGRRLRSIAIDYEHELLPGRHAQVRVLPQDDACCFEGSMEDKICFRLRLGFDGEA